MDGFLDCPFCGEEPDVETRGTCIDIECCCSMSFQKSDYLTMEERRLLNERTMLYTMESEEKVLKIARDTWNKRV